MRDAILDAASFLAAKSDGHEFRFESVAAMAEVDISTVEYFFDSVVQLKAEAQLTNYFHLIEPHHLALSRVETAVNEDDEELFWRAIDESMVLAWSTGQTGSRWGLFRLLNDIWSDPFSQSHFCELLDLQFERWIAVIERAKDQGWLEPDLDVRALVTVLWSASVGQVITAGSKVVDLSPQENRDFLMTMFRGRGRHAFSTDKR